jgi:hypothetical protein
VAGVRQLALRLAAGVPLGDGPPLVVQLLAARQAELDLGVPPLGDVQPKRDDGESLGLRLAQELVDLVAMEEQLAISLGLVVLPVAPVPRGDVRADEPGLTVVDARVRLGQVDLPGADGLDLGPGQDQASVEGVLDVVLVAGLPDQGCSSDARRARPARSAGHGSEA